MATATLYLYEDPNQTYSISCWADRSFSRERAIVQKMNQTSSTAVGSVTTPGTITAGSLTSMPSSNLQNLVFSYAKASNYKINISAATLYVTLASDTSFESLSVGNQLHSYPTYNTQYSGAVDLSGVNTTEKTITATLKIDPEMSMTVLQALGGGYSWSVQKEATVSYDQFYYYDSTDGTTYWYRHYLDGTGVQRSWCSAKVTNVYLVIEYEEDTSVIIDRSTAISMLNVGVSGVAKKISDMFIGVNGVAKKISEAWIGVNGIAKKIYPAYMISMLSPGDIIQIDEEGTGTTYAEWMVMHHNYYETGQTILMRKYCLPNNMYLNSSGGSGQYSYPYFDYNADNYLSKTWLTAASESFQNLLIETPIAGRTWSGGTVKTASRKIWLPSAVNLSVSSFEEGNTAYYDDTNGAFDYFATNDTLAARIAYITEGGDAVRWWTRTVTGGTHPYQRTINTSGDFSSYQYYNTAYLRPVINIYSNNYLEKISDGVYRMVGSSSNTRVETIAFTVDGIAYQAEDGMSWSEWVHSSYNTNGFQIVDHYVTASNPNQGVYTPSGLESLDEDYIYAGTAYEFGPGPV